MSDVHRDDCATWDVTQKIRLGRVLGPSLDFATLVGEPVPTLSVLVSCLNGGSIPSKSGFCVAFSCEDMSYHLLYKSGMKEKALDLLCTKMVDTSVSQCDLPPETQRILTERRVFEESGLAFQETQSHELSTKLEEARLQIQNLSAELYETTKKLRIAARKNAMLEMKLKESLKQSFHHNSQPSPCRMKRPTSRETTSTCESSSASGPASVWSLDRSIALGMLSPDSRLWAFAKAIDPEQVDSLRLAVSLLNHGQLKCDKDFVIVFSQASYSYHLLYPVHKMYEAQKLVSEEFVWLSSRCSAHLSSGPPKKA